MMTSLSDVADDERTARMVLSMLVEPNDPVTGRILSRVGAVETLWLAEHDSAVVGLSPVDAQVWRDRLDTPNVESVAARIDQIQQSGVHVLVPGDADWPTAIDDLGEAAPFVLWTRGASSFLSRPMSDLVTITGARACTSYGDYVARELASSVAAGERVVVAGGAYGIEGGSHQAALAAGGDTIAILANGVDRPYPAGHRDLLDRVADVGLLVSEVPPGAVPTRHRVIARARLMAALSSASVIVEAGARSGSLVVAQRAVELGRRVGAVPGPVTSAASVGAHRLLRDGIASLVADTSDLARLVERGQTPREHLGREPVRPSASASSHPETIEAVSAMIHARFDEMMAEGAAELADLASRRTQLEGEQQKLLQAHYAGAIPLDLLKREQDRITASLETIEHRITAHHGHYADARANLNDSLKLLSNAADIYEHADDANRRLINQALFKAIYIDEDNDVRVGYRNPYDGLSIPGLHADALSWAAEAKKMGQAGTATKGGPLVASSHLTHLG